MVDALHGGIDQPVAFAFTVSIGEFKGDRFGQRLEDKRFADAPKVAGAGRLPPPGGGEQPKVSCRRCYSLATAASLR